LKNPPKIFVLVEKKDRVLDVKLSKLSNGVYSLELDLNDAYGVMNVSVWTKSKPKMDQKFELDFGTPWLKIVGWRNAADKVAQDLITGWSVATKGATKGATDMQQYVVQKSLTAKSIVKSSVEANSRAAKSLLPYVDAETMLKRARLASKKITTQVAQQGEKIGNDLAVRAQVMTDIVQRVVTDQVAPAVSKAWWDVSRNVQNGVSGQLLPRAEASLRKAQAGAKRLVSEKARLLEKRKAERKKARLAKKCARGSKSCAGKAKRNSGKRNR